MNTPLLLGDFVRESEIVEWLRRLVQADSSNPPGQEESVAHTLSAVFEECGVAVTVDLFEPGRANVIARLRGGGRKPALLLSGHLDTVPVDASAWRYHPHSGTIHDGVLHGRGSVDMKGAIAAMTAACIAIARSRMELQGTLIFAGTAGEEVDSCGARRLLLQGLEPVGEIVVGEPTRLTVARAHKGALWLEIETTGKAAHGAMPEQGSNAILAMHRIISSLHDFRSDIPAHPLLGPATLNVGAIRGGMAPNIVPDRCVLAIDLRTLPGESHQQITEDLRQKIGGASIRVLNSMPSIESPLNSELIRSALDVMARLTGRAPEVRGMSYYSDASILTTALRVPTLICGPGDERLAHQVDEQIPLEDVFAAARFYFELIQARLSPTAGPMS